MGLPPLPGTGSGRGACRGDAQAGNDMTTLDDARAGLHAARTAQDDAIAARVAADAEVRRAQAALAAAQRQGAGLDTASEAAEQAQQALSLAHERVARAATQVAG